MRVAYIFYVIVLSLALATPATAADPHATDFLAPQPIAVPTIKPFFDGLYVHVGASALFTDPKMTATVGGAQLTGAGATIPPVLTGSAEIGYFFTRHIAVSIMAGYPPPVSAYGAGQFTPFGKLFTQVGGVALASVHYHWDLGRLHPYVGVGVGRSIAFHISANPAFQNFKVGNAFAPVLVGGYDVDIVDHVSLFFDVKKIWISQMATGDIALAPGVIVPIAARIRSDPLVTTAGIGYRF